MSKELEQADLFIDAGELNSLKDPVDGFNDPNAAYPTRKHVGVPTTPLIATGAETKGVYLGGASKDVGWELAEETGSQYPNCKSAIFLINWFEDEAIMKLLKKDS